MLTPEVQQYITQQRAAGVSDSQIRQALSAQGWSAGDLDQALGLQTSAAAVRHLPKMLITSVAVGAAVLIAAGIGFKLYASHVADLANSEFQSKLASHDQNTSGQTNQNPNNSSNATGTVCGVSSSKPKPENYPTDIPEYSGAVIFNTSVAGTLATGVDYCTEDSYDKVVNFFTSTSSPWNLADSSTQQPYNKLMPNSGFFDPSHTRIFSGMKGSQGLSITIVKQTESVRIDVSLTNLSNLPR